MSESTFQFELVSPERVLLSEAARMVVIPGTEGEFGVLAGHVPLLTALRPGVVRVTLPSGAVEKIFVAGGFADVSATACAVLAEEAVSVGDLDRPALEQELKNLADDLGFSRDDPQKSAHIRKGMDIARAKIAAVAA